MTGKFINIRCADCSNEQITFDRVSTMVRCEVCGATLTNPTGGKAVIKGKIVGELE